MIKTKQELLAVQALELAALLPPTLRAAWMLAAANTEACEIKPARRWKFRKEAKPVGLMSPGTHVLMLSGAMAMLAGGAALSRPVTTYAELLDPIVAQAILDGPLAGKARATRAMTLRAAAVFGNRCFGFDGSLLCLAAKRVLREEPAPDRSALRSHQQYLAAARSLDPGMEPGEEHGADTALWSRRAAIATIAVELAPRATELCGLSTGDIIPEGDGVTVIIPASLSKIRVSQVRDDISPEGSRILRDYLLHARPFLAQQGASHATGSDALWLSESGTPLSAQATLQAVRRDMARLLDARVCSNFLRSALVTDGDERDAADLIGHRLGSAMADDHYASWHLPSAIRDLANEWEEFD